MTTETQIKQLVVAEDTELRKQYVKIGGVWVKTPVKCIIPDKLYSDTIIPRENGLIEIHKRFKRDSLKEFETNDKISKQFSNSINTLKHKGGEENPSFTILCFDEEIYPSDAEINRLSRIGHAFSDITPIPSIPKIARKLNMNNRDNFYAYIDKSMNSIISRNKKPIMGYIPQTNIIITEELVQKYVENQINSFYIDLDGTSLVSYVPQIHAIKDILKENNFEENHFIHFINVRYGTTAINQTNVVPAKDIIGFCWGLDSFGGVHVGPKRNPTYYEWLKSKKNVEENKIRLFDKEGYGYHRVFTKNLDDVSNIFPEDSPIKLKDINFDKKTSVDRVSKIINLQQQIIESNSIAIQIDEKSNKTLKYFESKKYLDKQTLKRMKKI